MPEIAPALANPGIGAIEKEERGHAAGIGQRKLLRHERADVMRDDGEALEPERVRELLQVLRQQLRRRPASRRGTFETVRPNPRRSGAMQS